MLEGTLSIISRLGVKEYCELIQIGQGPSKPLHFSPGFTTDKDLVGPLVLA